MNVILFTVDESFSISVTALTGKIVESLNGSLTLAYISSSDDDREAGEYILKSACKLIDCLVVERIFRVGKSLDQIMAIIDEGAYDLVVFEVSVDD